MDGKSQNIVNDKIKQLKAILPEAVTEGKIDWEKLRLTLGDDVNVSDERYVLNWAGKSDAFRALQTPTTATLAPSEKESVNFNETQNIFIEGENLETLKVLQKAYYGKVKMIYIDPPYNTGSDSFVYPDRFAETREDYLKRINDKDEEGLLMREGVFRKNSKDSGHYHSNWLSMMYPRLFLARNLLSEGGIIVVSIDDNEVHNLRLLMNEVFGEENFVVLAPTIMNLKGNQDEFGFAGTHEYTLIYAKDISQVQIGEFDLKDEVVREEWEEDQNGYYKKGANLKATGINAPREKRPNLYYPIYVDLATGKVAIDRQKSSDVELFPITRGKEVSWRWSAGKLQEDADEVIVVQNENNVSLYKKQRPSIGDLPTKKPKSIFYKPEYSSGNGTNEFNKLMSVTWGNELRPKPVKLISDLVKICTTQDDLIIDFFAGSATISQAVLELNNEDGGKRNYICIQLPEATDENSDAFRAGYKTIADIGKERIRRVIAKTKKENPMFADKGQDLGFKVFKLKHSNFKLWRGDGIENGEELEKQLDLLADPVKPEALEKYMLFELLLKSGYALTTKIEKRAVGKSHYYLVDDDLVIALSHLSEAVVQDILEASPQQVICLDSLFADNDPLKTNTQLQFKDAEIAFHSI